MATTIQTILTNVKRVVLPDPSNTDQDNEIVLAINHAGYQLYTANDWQWKIIYAQAKMHTGLMRVVLDGNGRNDVLHGSVRNVRLLDTSQPVEKVDYERMVDADPDFTSSGTPFWWAARGMEAYFNFAPVIVFYPVPSSDYPFEYEYERAWVDRVAADNLPMPPGYEKPVEALAIANYLGDDLETERAQMWRQRAQEYLAPLLKRDTSSHQIQVVNRWSQRQRLSRRGELKLVVLRSINDAAL